jgi:hypothetical protein
MSLEQARRALRELGRLEAMIFNVMRACVAAGLDVGPLGSILSQVEAYTRRARRSWRSRHPRARRPRSPNRP